MEDMKPDGFRFNISTNGRAFLLEKTNIVTASLTFLPKMHIRSECDRYLIIAYSVVSAESQLTLCVKIFKKTSRIL